MSMRRILIAGATGLAAAAILSGCSGSSGAAPSTTVTVTTTVTASPSPATSKSPAQQSARGAKLALGTTVKISDASITVYSYAKDVAPSAPAPSGGGQRWDDANVKVCVRQKSTLSWEPWALLDSKDGRYDASSDQYDQFPAPAYPFASELVAAHSCTRGYIVFPVSKRARVRTIEYSLVEGKQAVVKDWRV